jgi:hypothetical protein
MLALASRLYAQGTLGLAYVDAHARPRSHDRREFIAIKLSNYQTN